jgi:hypothetical protein
LGGPHRDRVPLTRLVPLPDPMLGPHLRLRPARRRELNIASRAIPDRPRIAAFNADRNVARIRCDVDAEMGVP